MSWTDERVETLKRMWAEGQSASQIAKELGGVTRNAVIGKVHRLLIGFPKLHKPFRIIFRIDRRKTHSIGFLQCVFILRLFNFQNIPYIH